MEIDSDVVDEAMIHDSHVVNDDEEDVEDLLDLMDEAKVDGKNNSKNIPLLKQVTESTKSGPKATQTKERAVYELTRAYCAQKSYSDIVTFLESSMFFSNVNKAKCAKVVRQVLDIVCGLAPEELTMQREICEKIVEWCRREKRSFLRQRVEAKLAAVMFAQNSFAEALQLSLIHI